MDARKQKMLREICELAHNQNISFERLDTDKSKAGLVVEIINTTLRLADKAGANFVWRGSTFYLYVGSHWMQITSKEITLLLTTIATIGKIHEYKAKYHRFAEELYKQFRSIVKDMDTTKHEVVKINCANGTLVFGIDKVELNTFDKNDNFFYSLDYKYDPNAICPVFQQVLNDALPSDGQMVLQEYAASVFFPRLNLHKSLLLYGRGGEGKSLILNIISAALGRENVIERSIESLCAEESRTIADLEGKLLNIGYEMSTKFNSINFKQIVCKEPMPARRLYGETYTIYDYASLLFSCNELPKNIEHSFAYFRRLIILPFKNSIPEEKQDRTLGDRIIKNELSGVLNWIIAGAMRLIAQGKFSKSKIVDEALAEYKVDSDSVSSFLQDNNYEISTKNEDYTALKDLFKKYMDYCAESNCHACSLKTFSTRLKNAEFEVVRKAQGMFVCAKKVSQEIVEVKETSSLRETEWTLCH